MCIILHSCTARLPHAQNLQTELKQDQGSSLDSKPISPNNGWIIGKEELKFQNQEQLHFEMLFSDETTTRSSLYNPPLRHDAPPLVHRSRRLLTKLLED
ncbi:unnamed protein product [Arabidopsis halleri]